MSGPQIHWFSLLNSLLIVLSLSGMVAMILVRTLHQDIAKYNEISTAEEQSEDTGWKLLHGDVFRMPPFAKLLAVSVASGVQLLLMVLLTLVFGLLGFLSPAHRGGLLQSMMLLFTVMGVAAGYVASRVYKVMGGSDWKVTTALTATLYPGSCFGVFFILNLMIWGEKSSGAVPFTTMFAILALWFGISVPLVFLGAYFGFKKDAIELPVTVRPGEPGHMSFNTSIQCLLGGLMPFVAAFTELFFIMSSIWMHQFYYLFGFLTLMVINLIITSALMSIAVTYFQLTSEDYAWWWASFSTGASAALYVFAYSVFYFFVRLSIDKTVGTVLYFGYMGMMASIFGLITGSIGFISTFMFVRVIYSSIKVD